MDSETSSEAYGTVFLNRWSFNQMYMYSNDVLSCYIVLVNKGKM